MSVKYATPLELDFKRSRLFDLYVCSVFLISLFSIYLLPVIWIVKILLLLISGVACLYIYRAQYKVQRLVWQDDNHWLLVFDRETLTGELTDDGFAISWLVILHFKLDTGARYSQLICYDSLSRRVFRQLKVRLKVEGLKTGLHAKMGT